MDAVQAAAVDAACATAVHLPSVEHLEQCTGFAELSPEQQQELRGLGCLQEGS